MYRGSSHSSPLSPVPRLLPVTLLQAWKHFIPPLVFYHALHSCLNCHVLSLTHTHTHACITVLMNFSLCKVLSSFCVCVCVCVFVVQSCPTLRSMDCTPVGSSVHQILQASILEWDPFSRESSQPRDSTRVSCIASGSFTA